jgi:hypothetical protein
LIYNNRFHELREIKTNQQRNVGFLKRVVVCVRLQARLFSQHQQFDETTSLIDIAHNYYYFFCHIYIKIRIKSETNMKITTQKFITSLKNVVINGNDIELAKKLDLLKVY